MIDLEEFRRPCRALLYAIDHESRGTLSDIGSATVADIRANPRGFQRRTGKLQAGTRRRIIKTASGKLLEFENAVDYARPVSSGSRPHPITNANGTTWLHPGTKPTLFLERAATAMAEPRFSALERTLERAADTFSRR